MEHVHPHMTDETRELFERFCHEPRPPMMKSEVLHMLTYIERYGIHSVYCKIKHFMPRHQKALRAVAAAFAKKS